MYVDLLFVAQSVFLFPRVHVDCEHTEVVSVSACLVTVRSSLIRTLTADTSFCVYVGAILSGCWRKLVLTVKASEPGACFM